MGSALHVARDKSLFRRRDPAAKAKSAAAKDTTAPKFSDEAGSIWGGRGPRPKWLRDALTAARISRTSPSDGRSPPLTTLH
jgi:DNA-binding protein H-NS